MRSSLLTVVKKTAVSAHASVHPPTTPQFPSVTSNLS
jgi:hypothetical protein